MQFESNSEFAVKKNWGQRSRLEFIIADEMSQGHQEKGNKHFLLKKFRIKISFKLKVEQLCKEEEIPNYEEWSPP